MLLVGLEDDVHRALEVVQAGLEDLQEWVGVQLLLQSQAGIDPLCCLIVADFTGGYWQVPMQGQG